MDNSTRPLSALCPIAPDLLHALWTQSHAFCLTEGGSHGPDHSERVLRNCIAIGQQMQANLALLVPAALLHDIGRKEESMSRGKICHAQRGADLAAPLLQELGYPPAEIKAICHCIRTHRFRNCTLRPASLEAQILYDADKLDSIGAIGIGRAFLFAGQIGARLHNPDIDHTATASYSLEDTAYREFCVKLSCVRDQMLTPVGKKMAEQRHAFMQTFFDQLSRETDGI
jgi:uncharacterized protein